MSDPKWRQRNEAALPYRDPQTAPPLPVRADGGYGVYVPTTAETEVRMEARRRAAQEGVFETDVYREGRELIALAEVVETVGEKIAALNNKDPEGQNLVQNARRLWVASHIGRAWGRRS